MEHKPTYCARLYGMLIFLFLTVFQLSEAGHCFQGFYHGPYKSVSEIIRLLERSDYVCHPTDQFCKIKVHNNKIDASCQNWNHFESDCALSHWQNTDVCYLDLAMSGQTYECRICCDAKPCAYRFSTENHQNCETYLWRKQATNCPGVYNATASSLSAAATTTISKQLSTTPITTAATSPTTTAGIITNPPPTRTTSPTPPPTTTTTTTTTTETTTIHPVQAFLNQQCTDVVSGCTPPDCYTVLAPTKCRLFCNLCDYPLAMLDPSVPTRYPPPSTTLAPTATPPTASKAPPVVTVTPPIATLTPPTVLTTVFQTTAPLGCHDKFDDCASQLHICSSPYAGDICQKHCGLCPSTSAPCEDHLAGTDCQDLPHTCDNPLTSYTCAKTCGLCCES